MPDTTATMPAAAKALFMNSYWNMSVMMLLATMIVIMVVHVIGALDIAAARHDEDVPAGTQHLDFGAVERREHRRGHDFFHGAEHCLAVAEIEHAVDGAEQLVEF